MEENTMNHARIVDNVAVEVFTPPAGVTLADCFHPEVAAQFVPCPDNVTPGSTLDANGNWTIAPLPEVVEPPAPKLPSMDPMDFYLAFTVLERIAIKTSADAMVIEFWDTFQRAFDSKTPIDPNLVSVTGGLEYLKTVGIIATDERVAQILSGVPQ